MDYQDKAFAVCALLFLTVFAANTWSLANIGKPWGMTDVDNYLVFLQQYAAGQHVDDHYLTVALMHALGNYWFTPIVFGILFPWSVWFFLRHFLGEDNKAFIAFLLFIFGCMDWTFYWFSGLYAQTLACTCFCLSLGYLLRGWRYDLIPTFGFAVLACVFHSLIFAVYMILIMCVLVLDNMNIRALILGVLVYRVFLWGKFVYLLTPFNEHMLPEPSPYMMLFLYTFPLLWLLAYVNLGKLNNMSFFFVTLSVSMPFITYGRGMFFAHIFLVAYATKTLYEWKISNRFLLAAFIVLLAFWYQNYYAYISQAMAVEATYREISLETLSHIGIKPVMCIDLTKHS